MYLDLAFVNEYRSLHVRITGVDRGGDLVDGRFTHSGDTQNAPFYMDLAGGRLQLWQNVVDKHRLIFTRRARQDREHFAVEFNIHTNGRTVWIWKYLGPVYDVCLALV